VNTLIAFLANYLIFGMAAVFAMLWLFLDPRATKLLVAGSAVAGLLITFALILLAAKLHTDSRPFVQNPSLHPLIKHAADNGFPSDHSAGAGLIAALAVWRHRVLGAILGAAAIVVAAARVAAHVHHVQDVVAGLAIGVVAAALGILLASAFIARRSHRVETA
jgi:undecaprenyl-diphosphatase